MLRFEKENNRRKKLEITYDSRNTFLIMQVSPPGKKMRMLDRRRGWGLGEWRMRKMPHFCWMFFVVVSYYCSQMVADNSWAVLNRGVGTGKVYFLSKDFCIRVVYLLCTYLQYYVIKCLKLKIFIKKNKSCFQI